MKKNKAKYIVIVAVIAVSAAFLWSGRESSEYLALVLPKSTTSLAAKKVFDENISVDKKTLVEKINPGEYVKRKRAVRFNKAALPAKKSKITLDLFPDKSVIAVLKNTKEKSPTNYIWKGQVEGDKLSTVTMAVKGDKITGIIRSSKGDFEIKSEANGVHSIQEINYALFPRHVHLTPRRPATVSARVEPPQPASVARVATIDILVAYTQSALERLAGSQDELESTADAYIEDANASFEASNILIRLNKVGSALAVDYRDTPNDIQTDYARLVEPRDGYMDNVHAERNSRQADIVVLFMSGGTDACGVGYQMNQDNWDFFDTRAFSAVRLGCLSGHALAHEIGHNLGAAHNLEDADHTPFQTYGYGYRTTSVRTIMSYPCVNDTCRILPVFSSARTRFSNMQIGSADTDNARAINSAREIAAGWRGGITIPKNLRNIPL